MSRSLLLQWYYVWSLGYISTIYFVINQKEQHIDLNMSNNTNRYDRQKQNIIYKKKSVNN